MSGQLNKEVICDVKQLITNISGFEEGTGVFNSIQKRMVTQIKKADSLYFLNIREIDESIESMSEKFLFHGFGSQSKALKAAYKKYVTKDIPKNELVQKLNIVKFLLCMSESPTTNFWKYPEEFTKEPDDEEVIDWKEYLNEGIEQWMPEVDESSDYSDASSLVDVVETTQEQTGNDKNEVKLVINNSDNDVIVDFNANREELLATIQHSWYNQKNFFIKPGSEWREANVGILWDDFLNDQVNGLIDLPRVSVTTEYKVMREIIWQLWGPHNSTNFELVGNKIKPKSNITISSIREIAFEPFMWEFIPYIELLDFFREFSKTMEIRDDKDVLAVPQTYRSYEKGLQSIVNPVYVQLCDLEDKIRQQDTTMTLIKLAYELRKIFEPLNTLKKIHDSVVDDFGKNSFNYCASSLLVKLHNSLDYTVDKLEQDLRVALFMESLFHYFHLIDSWLMKDDFADYTGEFLIVDSKKPTDSKMKFILNEDISELCKNDGIMKIIIEQVLEIGRNIHLLRLLGKYDLIGDYEETIHEEFVRKTIEELCRFFNVNCEEILPTNDEVLEEDNNPSYKYPVICVDDCKKPTEMDKLENLVDTSDGFLMVAFEKYFMNNVKIPEKSNNNDTSLYDKLSKVTKTFFPTKCFFENIFASILKDRFTISGLMLKNLLIEKYKLDKQFEFLRHIFLFFDDLIFPFYRELFEKLTSNNKNWGNGIWLTSHLHDIINDIYPDFYENCTVQVKDHWKQCLSSLDACEILNLRYETDWPINIIITNSNINLYKEVFEFLLKIKWALYTLNHLNFSDIETKKKYKDRKFLKTKTVVMKLKYLRFSLINIINNIQHFVFGLVFKKCLMKFELDFEKSNDLTSIINSHLDFINSIHNMVKKVRDCGQEKASFNNLMQSVRLLDKMWKNMEHATLDRLNECHQLYQSSFMSLDAVIHPVYIFDY